MENNRLRVQIENLKYDRDLLVQESRTLHGVFNRKSINQKIKNIENKIFMLELESDVLSTESRFPTEVLQKLSQKMIEHFNNAEISGLCFELSIDYEEVMGEGKSDTIRKFILYMKRRGRIGELITSCRQLRPNISW